MPHDRRGAAAPVWKGRFINLGVSVASLVVIFGCMELGARIYKGEYGFRNFWRDHRSLLAAAYPSEFDPDLGWVPRPGATNERNAWETNVTILTGGIRSNGGASRTESGGGLIMAVGDSFTFGDQVSDQETWPALLEGATGVRTINGGVFGYGLDQIYLRLMSLTEEHEPSYVIFSFIPSDIVRCEYSNFAEVPKPYFQRESGKLVLKKEHVREMPQEVDAIKYVLGYSFLIHKVMSRAFPTYWFQGLKSYQRAHTEGEAVACALLENIERWLDEHPSVRRFYVLLQYGKTTDPRSVEIARRVSRCISGDRVETIDLMPLLDDLRKHDEARYAAMFRGHMTAEGNRFVAEVVAERMRRDGSLAR